MKILLISRGTPSSRDPQWGSFEIDQALALSLYGHDVVIISVDRRFRTYYRKHGITKYIYNGIPCYNSYIIPAVLTNIFSRKITEYVTKGQIRKLYNMVLDDYGMPDLIYAHYLPNIELGLYLKNQYGIPVVGIEHWIINLTKNAQLICNEITRSATFSRNYRQSTCQSLKSRNTKGLCM